MPSVPSAGAAFNKRYAELATNADLIMYNGHAGLGANVRYLSTLGHWFPGKYQILFMDGCDTFAYIDDTIPKQRAALNPDDPTGDEVHGHGDQRDAGVLRLARRLDDGADPRAVGAERARELGRRSSATSTRRRSRW